MNIFVLDESPAVAATYHYDIHVRKMILESVQMMMTTYHLSLKDQPELLESFINSEWSYKLSHKNHPCTKWVRESLSNFLWLLNLTESLNEEYKYRSDKSKDHKSLISIKMIISIFGYPNIEDKGLTPFVKVMPSNSKTEDPVESYRQYYSTHKLDLMKFTKREIPLWISEAIH